MEAFSLKAWILATILATALSVKAYRKKSLTTSGCIVAFMVGFALVVTGLRGLNLFVFYQLGTTATRYQQQYKSTFDASVVVATTNEKEKKKEKKKALRGPSQVLACSIGAVLLSLYHAFVFGSEKAIQFQLQQQQLQEQQQQEEGYYQASCLACAILSHHATCLADTLASELGMVSRQKPVSILMPWKGPVPSGTNGGVTMAGFGWSALGGTIIGISTLFWDILSGTIPSTGVFLYSFQMIVFGTVCGLLGSIFDSILGATVQQTYYDSDTKMVYQAEQLEQNPNSNKTTTTTSTRTSTKSKQLVFSFSKNWLTNEQVNLVSVLIMSWVGGWILGPIVFF